MKNEKFHIKIKNLIGFFILLFTIYCLLFTSSVKADEYDDLQKKINELNRALEMSKAATAPLESTLVKLEKDIADIREQIAYLEKELKKKEEEVAGGEKLLSFQQEILERKVRSLYKNMYQTATSNLQVIFGKNLSEVIRILGYQKSVVNDDKNTISDVVLYIKDLEEKKKQIENQKVKLAQAKENIDSQAEFFRKEIAGAKKYQIELGKEIANLTARQQEILSAKTGLFSTSVGDVPAADDPNSRPDYNPGFSPAFAAFSFGAPHFKGMSQYGAYGRAKNGQGEEDILRAYYGNVRFETVDTGGNINTTAGSMNFEDRYLLGIAEMPSDWNDNNLAALKAQAVAARSYALSYIGWRMNNRNLGGGSICTTEQCQVWSSGKANSPPDNWRRAVSETRGKIVVSNNSNEIVNAWYASTSGGYQESYASLGHSTPGFWDTKNGRSGWTSEAYEKISGSPWFYKGWYKTRSGLSCGRSHPWLTSEEFADIVNAAIVYANGGDISGIFPLDVQSCFGGSDQPWSRDRLKQEADKYGDGLTSVSSVSVQYREDGLTGKVIVNGREIDGQKFYKAFNLRAPGAIHLKSGLFNIEKK